MDYTRGGRPLQKVKGNILIVEDLNMEGVTGKIYSKAGKIPKGYFVYRSGKKVKISQEEYEKINSEKFGGSSEDASCKNLPDGGA